MRLVQEIVAGMQYFWTRVYLGARVNSAQILSYNRYYKSRKIRVNNSLKVIIIDKKVGFFCLLSKFGKSSSY